MFLKDLLRPAFLLMAILSASIAGCGGHQGEDGKDGSDAVGKDGDSRTMRFIPVDLEPKANRPLTGQLVKRFSCGSSGNRSNGRELEQFHLVGYDHVGVDGQ